MSRRTAESNKAILGAWNKEQELVLAGKGTREWTPQQQEDILNKGKAYDDDGVAFQGQHMKSAEKYPEYQGELGNIQFLTRSEHLEAHNGNWKNPTNWYFNPATKEKIDFGEGKFIPCKTIQLSESIITFDKNFKNVVSEENEIVNEVGAKNAPQSKSDIEHKEVTLNEANAKRNVGGMIRNALKSVVDVSNQHPVLTNLVKVAGVAGLTLAAIVLSDRDDSDSGNSSDNLGNNLTSNGNNLFKDRYEDEFNDDTSVNLNLMKRSLPEEHMVRPHGQHYHTKEGLIWKSKDSYTRGGNREEGENNPLK